MQYLTVCGEPQSANHIHEPCHHLAQAPVGRIHLGLLILVDVDGQMIRNAKMSARLPSSVRSSDGQSVLSAFLQCRNMVEHIAKQAILYVSPASRSSTFTNPQSIW